jgi:uncharacterized repeat protein (TIGR01451 family)
MNINSRLCQVLWLVLVGSALLPGPAAAVSRYVRPAVSGSYGAGDGLSHASAWNGLANINWSLLAPGDTLYVCGTHAGVNDNSMVVAVSGQVRRPVVISGFCYSGSENDPGVIFSVGRRFTPADWTDSNGDGIYTAAYADGCTNPTLLAVNPGSSLSVTNPGTAVNHAKDNFSDPMANLAGWPANTFYQPTCPGTVYYKPPAGGPPPLDLYAQGPRVISINDRSYIVVRGLTLYAGGSSRAVSLSNADYVTVENNELVGGFHSMEVDRDSDYGVFRSNIVRDPVGSGLLFFADSATADADSSDNWRIENNEIFNVSTQCRFCGLGSDLPDRHAIGFQSGNNTIIQYNHIHHVGGEGVVFYNWSDRQGGNAQRNNLIRYNLIQDVRDLNPRCLDGTAVCANQRGIEMGSDPSSPDPETITGNIVHHNVLVRVHGTALRTKSTKPLNGYSWRFLNNTVVDSGLGFEFSLYSAAYGHLAGLEFRNNIIHDSVPDAVNPHVRANAYVLATDVSGVGFSHNLFHPDGPTAFRWIAQNTNFAGWVAYSGFPSAGSVTSNPAFMNASSGTFLWAAQSAAEPGAGDYQLASTSPALNAGLNVGLTADMLGNPVAGSPDFGAYEYLFADLAVSLGVSPDPVILGSLATYATTVSNLGPITATGVSASGTLPGCVAGTLLPGTSVSCSHSLTVGTWPFPLQTMTVAGNETDLVPGNNRAEAVVGVLAPELRSLSFSFTVNGNTLSVTDKAANYGNTAAGSFAVRYYLSLNTTYDAADIPLISAAGGVHLCQRVITGLVSGGSSQGTDKPCYRPAAAQSGVTYYLIAFVDPTNSVVESQEGNNRRVAAATVRW